jgi:iron complex outermembrane receptor protein
MSALIVGTSCISQVVWAQEAPPSPEALATGGGINQIIVTAERREESVQDASLTIQVLSGEALTNAGLTSSSDLVKLTTGVEVGAGGSNTQIYVRGVGSFAFSPLAAPGVAFNVDGVYVGRPTGLGGNFYDIARVEVLKGPQGTLYGRNANGGSINVVTNEPRLLDQTVTANLELGNYDLVHASAAINLPVGDQAAVRAAFNIVDRDGYLSDGTFDDVQQSGRVRFKWEPTEDISLLLNADYSHIGGEGSNAVWLPRRPGSSPYEAVSEPEANAHKITFGALGAFTTRLGKDTFQDNNLYNISAQLDWDLGLGTLTILPAYRRTEVNYQTNDVGGRYLADQTADQQSLEVRLGNSVAGLDWVVGAYYYNEEQEGSTIVNNGDIRVPFLGRVLQVIRVEFGPKTRAYAAFGQATFEVLEGLRLIAGARYTYEKAESEGFVDDISVTPSVRRINFPGEDSFEGITYKGGFEYDITPENMLYATYSSGFKAGGFAQASAPTNTFDPEKLYAAEIGSKNRFLDNMLQVNVSAFHWKYKDLQDSRVNLDSSGQISFITFNSGDATIYGGTVDVIAAPTDNDTFSLSAEYAHSKYDNFTINTPAFLFASGSNGCALSNVVIGGVPNVQQDCSGFQVARIPKVSATASYDHVFPLADGAEVTAGARVKYSSSRWIGIDFIPSERDGAYTVLDLDLTYRSPDDSWSLGLFGRNLTESVYYTGGSQTAFNTGLFAANIGAPRTYGVRAGVNF